MKTLQEMQHCPHCGKMTLHIREHHECSHLVHALVTLFLFGLWFPIWIICTCSANKKNLTNPAQCTACGNAQRSIDTSSSATQEQINKELDAIYPQRIAKRQQSEFKRSFKNGSWKYEKI